MRLGIEEHLVAGFRVGTDRDLIGHRAGGDQGLLKQCLDKDADGNVVRKAGVMGVVITGGEITPGDTVRVELPDGPHEKLVAI